MSRSLTELTRQITPPTKNGHAPLSIGSRKSSQSVNPLYVWTWWVSPCWVKLSRRLPQIRTVSVILHFLRTKKQTNLTPQTETVLLWLGLRGKSERSSRGMLSHGTDYILSLQHKERVKAHYHLVSERLPVINIKSWHYGVRCGFPIVASLMILPYPRSLPRPSARFRCWLGY